ncbi:MAG: type II toxin-antitoxin system Phd/YefM family antitoxin [Candidatus Hydrogenedentes bacterium]|nr:type II toxin-antitoxin system Phd/YefM family antitoxin [Candidatus Hydrogenedentota bacterium]
MRIASVADVKARFSGYLKICESGPVVVTKNGKPVAMLLAMNDQDEIERILLAYSPKFQSILRTAEKQLRAGKGIPHEEFWSEVKSRSSGA